MADKWIKNPLENRDALVKGWLKSLLEKEIVKGVVVPSTLPSGANAAQSLITDPAMLEHTEPFAPVMAVSTAKILSKMTRLKPMEKPIAVLLRPCELRATIELTKLKQAHLDNLLLISMDCAGTFSVKTHTSLVQEGADFAEIERRLFAGEEDPLLRPVCQGCEWSVPDNCDITIARFGLDEGTFGLIAHTERGEAALAEMEGEAWENAEEARNAAVETWTNGKIAKRDAQFAELKERVAGVENLLKTYAACINCHNCMSVCPVCYRRQCYFESPTFEFDAQKYLNWAERKGAIKVPSDTLMFHITRMNHMGKLAFRWIYWIWRVNNNYAKKY